MKLRYAELARMIDHALKTSTGFDFIKGADGRFQTVGATAHDLRLMRAACTEKVRIKASGGVRDLEALLAVRALGAARCGTSATAQILDEARRRETGDGTTIAASAVISRWSGSDY